MFGIYTASKLKYAPMWKLLRSRHTNYIWTSTWLDTHRKPDHEDNPPDPLISQMNWLHNVIDVARANVLLHYTEADDIHRGSLIEIGVAFAQRIPVILVGEHKYSTWKHHPFVSIARDMDQAMWAISSLEKLHDELDRFSLTTPRNPR